MATKFWQGVWRVADPKITLASVASMVLGAGVAAHDGPIAWGWLGMTVLGIFCFEAAKNASGEVVDWDSGTDRAITDRERTPFSGGKRVLVDGLLTRGQTMFVAGVFYALGVAAGFVIVLEREPSVLWLGMLGVGLAFFYHAPPFKLAYRGFGELAVAIAYGPVIACGTYLVQRHDVSLGVLLSSIPLGIAIMAFLWINEIPDRRADASAGKRNLVVRLGLIRATQMFPVVVVAAYASLLLLPIARIPLTVWLGLIGLPHGIAAIRRLRKSWSTPAEMVPGQAWTLLSFVLMSVGMAAGWVWGL